MKQNLRQAIEVTPRQLMNKALKLLEEAELDTKCLVPITNKTGLSDDWKLEK